MLGSTVGAAFGSCVAFGSWVDVLADTVRPAKVPAVTAAPATVSTPAVAAVAMVMVRTRRWARSRSAGEVCFTPAG